jgi:flagellar M-ring protein FliF
MVFGTIAILLAVVILTTINLSKTEYATAFRNLQPNDAASIKKYLEDSKIPFELSADGTSIAVPASQAASVKLDVESQGLNKNGSLGYGAFEGSNTFGMSDNEFNVKLVNAMQGEIQQMFNQINGVASSKVLITVPKESAFITTEPQDSTASVILNIESGYRFDQAQIDTMYNLVAKTIPKLKYENITISNQNGELLPYSKTNGAVAGNSGQIQQQFQIKNQFQNDLQKNIMSLLGKIYAPNKVVVSVFSTLNFDQKTSKQNLVTPVNTVDNRGIEISLQENNKTSTSTGASPGVPGTANTDVPTYQGGQAGGGQSQSEETNRIVNFEVNRITNEIVSSPFIVKDLSISVGIEPPVRDDPNSLTQEMKDNIQRTLASIVSATLADSGQTFTEADIARKVTLFAQPFASTPDVATASTNYWMWGGIGLAALLVAGIGGYMLRMRRQRRAELLEEELAPQTQIETPTIDIEQVTTQENQVRKQLEGLAKRKPEEFVNLLRTWLVDE